MIPESIEQILQLACEWAQLQETLILQKGNPLSSQLLLDAEKIGVIQSDKVRILAVSTIPRPEHPLLEELCRQRNFLTSDTLGLTLRYGIYIRSNCINDRSLLVHELVHVWQYEQLGGFRQFLQKYLPEVLTLDYPNTPMEQEAVNKARNIILQG